MELIRGHYNLRPRHHGCVATVGNFDGIHLGHQAVLGRLCEKAAELALPSVVVTFEPHPQEFFDPGRVPMRLTGFREKMQTLRRYAVDRVLCIRFDRAFSRITAQAFIDDLLLDALGVRCLVIGDDFHFGFRRQGDIAMLQTAGAQHGFQVIPMHAFEVDGTRVSSTRIREALCSGDLGAAGKLLGRSYRLSGRIVEGDRRGRQLGFPTANIHLHRRTPVAGARMCAPLSGVFAVEVYGLEREPLRGVANIGVRPTVDGTKCLLEVHLLDFDQDIYGRHVQVEFLTRLRGEVRFDGLDGLKRQIRNDIARAREFFERRPPEQGRITVSG